MFSRSEIEREIAHILKTIESETLRLEAITEVVADKWQDGYEYGYNDGYNDCDRRKP